MAHINPHINFNGNAEEAFTFYKSVLGGEFAMIKRFKDLSTPEFPVAPNEANKIMFIALPIGKNMLMANDIPEFMRRVNENIASSESAEILFKQDRHDTPVEWFDEEKVDVPHPVVDYNDSGHSNRFLRRIAFVGTEKK